MLFTDGSQSMHMYGNIPDARSSYFDIWRDYEEIRISDVSYFLRLNHSRLVVSSLKWRPDLKQDVQVYTMKHFLQKFTGSVLQNTYFSKKNQRSIPVVNSTSISDISQALIPDVK